MKVFYYRKEEKKREGVSMSLVSDGHVDYFYVPGKNLALSKRERPLQSESQPVYSIVTDANFLEDAKKMLLRNSPYLEGIGGFTELDMEYSEVANLITSFEEKERLEVKVDEGMAGFFKKVEEIVKERKGLFKS
jgi:hypothetical protein